MARLNFASTKAQSKQWLLIIDSGVLAEISPGLRGMIHHVRLFGSS